MNLPRKIFLPLLMAIPLLLVASTCDMISLNGTTYSFATSQACTGSWRDSAHPTEDYTFCWIFTDGSYVRTNAYDASVAGTPKTTLLASDYPVQLAAVEKLIQTTVSNRYGDDNDKKKVIGGAGQSGIPLPSFNTFTNSQAIMNAPAKTKIQTDHSNNEVAKNAPLLLILTINNDHINNNDSLDYLLTEEPHVLRLYHKNASVNYIPTSGQTTSYPSGRDQYFAFAPPNNSQFIYNSNAYVPVQSWSVQSNFAGHEKNIYCMLNVPTIEGANDNNRTLDTFVAVLTKMVSGQHQFVSGSESTLPIGIGKSHDPNVIEVNIPTSTQCGPDANGVQEELEYTVHFQNIGSDPATTVEVNLDIDPHLNNSSLTVTEIGIGMGSATAATGMSQARTGYNGVGRFEYSVGTSNTSYATSLIGSQVSSITADAKFLFSNIQLAGINAANVQDSKGYIKFKIKTAGTYQVIHNQAGIFFDDNLEIVTNLAETRCLKDSINMNCDSCRMHLRECRDQLNGSKTDSSNSWMNWLGWIIAGLELLIIIYLLTRKRN